jgi:hypothetical protein
VDGALIKYFIQTLHWLGMADLASHEEGKEATAFNCSFNVERSTLTERLALLQTAK